MARSKRIQWRSGNTGVLYLRVSSRGQVDTEFDAEGMSLPAQRRKCYERAREKGYTVVDELVDAGFTATSIDERKSYQELIERVRSDSSISFVMVYSVSRLHRNWPEAGAMMLELSRLGIRIVSAMENIDFGTNEGFMMLGIMFSIHGYQSAAAGKDLQFKMTQKALIGGTPGWVPIGYVNVRVQVEGRNVNTVAVDEPRAPFVKLAFEWFATGQYTYDELTDKLNDAGFRSRPNRKYPERPVSRHTVETMLRNRYYLGYVTFSGVEYRGRHEALVSQALFDRVQGVLAAMAGNSTRQRRYNHYLKGLVWCRRCKRRLIVMRGKSKTGQLYFYYVCRGRQDKSCDLPYLRAVSVQDAVAAHYRTVGLPAELRQRLSDAFDAALKANDGQDAKAKILLRRRLTELERQEDRYIDAIADPDYPKDKITSKLRDIRDERARLHARLNDTEKELEAAHRNLRAVLDYLDDPYSLYERCSAAMKAKLNRLFFDRLWIDVREDNGTYVADDRLTPPFATVVYLRREHWSLPDAGWGSSGNRQRDSAAHSRVLALVKPMFSGDDAQSSSNSTLAEDRGFEPLRDCSQPAFQASALGH
jgi:site-specific DNA recombinase